MHPAADEPRLLTGWTHAHHRLAGGVGGARFLRGLLHHLESVSGPDTAPTTSPSSPTPAMTSPSSGCVARTSTPLYTLGGGISEAQGGAEPGSRIVSSPSWRPTVPSRNGSGLGDLDFATHIVRSQWLGQGATLSEVTSRLASPMGIAGPRGARDAHDRRTGGDPRRRRGRAGGSRAIHFQEWWVRHGATLPAQRFVVAGLDRAAPPPGAQKPSVTPTSSFCRPAIRWSPSASSWASPASGMHCAGPAPRSSASRRSSTANPSAATPMPVWPRSVCRRRPWRWPASTGLLDAWLIDPADAGIRLPRARRDSPAPAHARRGVRRGHRRRSARFATCLQPWGYAAGPGSAGPGPAMTAPLVSRLAGVTEGADLAALLAPTLAGMPRSRRARAGPLEVAGLRAPPAADKDAVIAAGPLGSWRNGATGGRVTRIVAAAAGPVMAAAGVDTSNVGVRTSCWCFPAMPTRSPRRFVRMCSVCWPARHRRPGGRRLRHRRPGPWRGVSRTSRSAPPASPLIDHRGRLDADGRQLSVTVRCPVDELAAADLVEGKASGIPAALVTGLPASWFDADAAGAGTVVRTGPGDWFALGHVGGARRSRGPRAQTLLHHRDPFGRRPRPLVCSRAPGARGRSMTPRSPSTSSTATPASTWPSVARTVPWGASSDAWRSLRGPSRSPSRSLRPRCVSATLVQPTRHVGRQRHPRTRRGRIPAAAVMKTCARYRWPV